MAHFGMACHQLITVAPCAWLAQVNAAPTLTFLNAYIKRLSGARMRIPSGVAHERPRESDLTYTRSPYAAASARARPRGRTRRTSRKNQREEKRVTCPGFEPGAFSG